MTKRESERREHMYQALAALGLSREESDSLRRISMTLSAWAERCCNEDIEERDDGSAWMTFHYGPIGQSKSYRIPNRSAGALKRLAAILGQHSRRVTYYHQQDPRGAALYIIPCKKLRERMKSPHNAGKKQYEVLDSCYSSVGIAVY